LLSQLKKNPEYKKVFNSESQQELDREDDFKENQYRKNP
jgi:hypothetical protein